MKFTAWCQKASGTRLFQDFFTGVILFAAVLVGIGIYPTVETRYREILGVLDLVVIALFTVEVAVGMGTYGSKPWKYFEDGWNIFDFVIVFLSIAFLLPLPIAGGEFVPAIRSVRLLRTLKLARTIPQLQFVVELMLGSVPFVAPIFVLLGLILVLFGVMGTQFFGSIDPKNFGSFHASFFTLYAAAQGSSDPLWALRDYSPVAGTLFASIFSPLGQLIMGALIIGGVMSVMEQRRQRILLEQSTRVESTQDPAALAMSKLQAGQRLIQEAERILQIAKH